MHKLNKMPCINSIYSPHLNNEQDDLPSFLSPCLITVEPFSPDFLLLTESKILYTLELKIGFVTNIQIDSNRKAAKYRSMVSDLSPYYGKIMFINLSMSAIGVMDSSCISLLSLLHELRFDTTIQKTIITKDMNISIRTSYFFTF